MRQRAIDRGLRLNEYGLFRSKEETRDPKLLVKCRTEEEIFEKLGLHYIPPEMREDMGEIALAEKGPLPRLIEWTDLKGLAAQSLHLERRAPAPGGNCQGDARAGSGLLGDHGSFEVLLSGQRPRRGARAAAAQGNRRDQRHAGEGGNRLPPAHRHGGGHSKGRQARFPGRPAGRTGCGDCQHSRRASPRPRPRPPSG